MKTRGERLRAEREARKMTQSVLAKAAGVSKQAISKIELDGTKEPQSATLEPVAALLGLNTRWLQEGVGPKYRADEPEDDFANVRASNQSASMGGGAESEEYAEAHKLKFRRESLQRKRLSADHLRVYYGRGDSMEPTLQDGDAIMYDTSDTKEQDDEIFVIWYRNRLYVKRLRVIDDIILIASDNPIGKWRQQIRVKPGDAFQIEGKVKWVARWVQC